jgi:hypothetical protein
MQNSGHTTPAALRLALLESSAGRGWSFLFASFLAAAFLFGPATATADEESWRLARQGKLAYVAFSCATLARHMGDDTKAKTAFNIGVESARKFVEAIRSNRVLDSDFRSEVPRLVMWTLQGPSTDFIVGRIFQATSDYQDDYVNERAKMLAASGDFNAKKAAGQQAATLKYMDAGCPQFEHSSVN